MTNLKKAKSENKINEFMNKNKHLMGDKKRFAKLVSSICKNQKEVQKTSSQDSSVNCGDTQTP